MPDKKKIVVLGGGYAGLMTVVTLMKKVHVSRADIKLVNNNDYHYITTKIHESAAGTLMPESIKLPINELVDTKRVSILKDLAVGIDPEKRKVALQSGLELDYDYLVVGLGGEPKTFNIPGLQEHGYFLFNWEGTFKLKNHIESQFEAYAEDGDESRLTFTIGGAGFTGMEFLYELLDRIPELCSQYRINEELVKVVCVEASDYILKGYDGTIVENVTNAIKGIKCEFLLNTAVTTVGADEVALSTGEVIPSKTMIWSGGVQGNRLLQNIGFETFSDGRVKVNEYLEVPNYKEVQVLGDAAVSFDEKGNPYPPTAQIAIQQGQYCAYNISTKIYFVKEKPFKYIHRGTVMSLGRKNAAGIVYDVAIKGKFAALMKWVIEMRYYYMLGGVPLVRKQMKKQNR